MAKVVFKEQPGKKLELFPENIFDRIPENHPVRLIDKIVDSLDISDILKQYKGGGASAYHPKMMLKVLFYAYLSNIYSCRKIEKALTENIYFMYISGDSTPDFRTINNFRGNKLKDHIKTLFSELIKILVGMGYISLDVQYIDGTKIEAKSNKYTFVWRKSVEKYKDKLDAKIRTILSDIESSIQSDNQELVLSQPSIAISSVELAEKISELNELLKSPTKQQSKDIKSLQKEHLPKLEKYEKDLSIMGDRNSYSKTDPDATFMRMKDDRMNNGQLKPAYNAQLSTENQFITHVSIHQTPGDTTTLESHLEGFESSYHKQSDVVVADAGYGSEENYELLEKKKVIAYVKYNYFHKEQTKKIRENPFLVQNLYYNSILDFYVCPMGQRMYKIDEGIRTTDNGYNSQVSYYQAIRCDGCPLRGKCHRSEENRVIEVNHRLNELRAQARSRLQSDEGIKHCRKRSVEVEAVFGQLKSNNKFNRFTFKGLLGVELETLLMAIGHNLRKMVANTVIYVKNAIKTKKIGQKIAIKIKICLFFEKKSYFQIFMAPKKNLTLKVA